MKRWLVIAVVCACGKSDSADKGGGMVKAKGEALPPPTEVVPAEPAKPPPLAGLKVTAGGKPVAMLEAYIKRLPAQRYSVFVTDQKSSCEELMSSLYSSHPGEHTLLAELGHRLAPDGTLSSQVIQFFDKGGNEPKPGSKVTVTEKGDQAELALDVTAGELDAHGTFTAKQCGDAEVDKSGIPKAKHPSEATIEVAGHKLPLVGAIMRGNDVTLSTGQKDCSTTTQWAELILTREGGSWKLHGEWLAQEAGNYVSPDDKMAGVKVKRGAKGKSDDGPTVQLELSGKGKAGDYPVALAGTIEALDCAK